MTPRFKEGEWARVRAHYLSNKEKFFNAGLAVKWEGPFRVIQVMTNAVYLVALGDRKAKIHARDLRPVKFEEYPLNLPIEDEPGGESDPEEIKPTKQRGRPLFQ